MSAAVKFEGSKIKSDVKIAVLVINLKVYTMAEYSQAEELTLSVEHKNTQRLCQSSCHRRVVKDR